MLTTMFYYNHYKPYIFKSEQKKAQAKQEIVANKHAPKEKHTKQFLLNKTLSKNVVKYAHDISYNMVDLKDAAKYTTYDIDDFMHNTKRYGYKKAKDILKNDLSIFVDQFNKSYNFSASQMHSQSLFDFSHAIDGAIDQGESKLSYLGIIKNELGELSFDSVFYDNLSLEELDIHMTEARSVFGEMYSECSNMLTQPLAEHMNFRNLNYYYNYKYGGVVADTFRLIESGMIVDIAI